MPKFLVTLTLHGYHEIEVEADNSDDAENIVKGFRGNIMSTPDDVYQKSLDGCKSVYRNISSPLTSVYTEAFEVEDDCDDEDVDDEDDEKDGGQDPNEIDTFKILLFDMLVL